MQIHTPSEHVLVKPLLDPESRTETVAGSTSVDCKDYTRALLIVHLGAHDNTTGNETLDIKLQESSDNGGSDAFADVTNGAFGQFGVLVPNANTGNVYLMNIDLTKRERYLRVYCTAAGTTPISVYGVTMILFNGRQKAPSQDFTVVSI